MNNGTVLPCSDGRLEILLYSGEESAEYRIAADHLESCRTCQTRLSELAANEGEWAKATRSLRMNEEDEQIERERAESAGSTACQEKPSVTWSDSMARQLLSPPSHPEMLGRLGRYEIERVIGAGGMGVVFRGFDSDLNRPVAIKVLAPHLAGSGAARTRFAREARAAAAIVHEHVVAIHNVESNGEPPFLVMQYVAGQSLQTRLDREGPLGVCEVLRIARQTAAGLAAAHEQGLVHRDVKPSNILLEQGVERALLTDFGLARASDDASLTHSGHVPGTPHYMSPEQARGETADQRSDLFSLGSVMYAMCTGRPPFRADTSYGVLRRITDSEPRSVREVNPEIPPWLCCTIEKLLEKSSEQRFASAAEVAELLGQCLAHVRQPDSQSLPACISVLVSNADRKKRATRRGLGRLTRASKSSLARLAIASLIVVAAVFGTQRYWKTSSPDAGDRAGPVGPRAPRKDASARSTPPETEFDSDPATNWDSLEVEVRQLERQSDSLTSRVDWLWDDVPTERQSEYDHSSSSADEPPSKEPVP